MRDPFNVTPARHEDYAGHADHASGTDGPTRVTAPEHDAGLNARLVDFPPVLG
ncbi:MAG: hypothetical protein ACR2FH_04600 [Caulobacteraceae bacterium]